MSSVWGQDNVDQHITDVQIGKIKAAKAALPALLADYPNHASVLFLSALLEEDGEKAKSQYQQLYKNHPNTEYSDEAVMKIAEFYYAAGLYIQSAEWAKRMALYYSRSEHMDRAVKLFLNALIISGSKDTALYYSKVFKKQFPKMDVDTKLSQLLNEHEAEPVKASEKVEVSDKKDVNAGIFDKIVETLKSPVPDEIGSPVKDVTPSSSSTSTSLPFSLQVGAYSKELNADHQKSQLVAAGYNARVDLRESNGRTLYAVRIGYYADRMVAKEASRGIKSTLGIDTIVISNK